MVAAEALRKELAERIAAGDLVAAFAHVEREARHDLADVALSARKTGEGFVLDGVKSVVPHGDRPSFSSSARAPPANDTRATACRSSSSTAKAQGRDAARLSRSPTARQAPRSGWTMSPSRLTRSRRGGAKASPLIERVTEEAIAALCAEAVGVMSAMCDMTVDLSQDAQAVRPADRRLPGAAASRSGYVHRARASAQHGGLRDHDGRAKPILPQRAAAISAAKVTIGRNGRFIGEQAVQLHGGIGMTMEYRLGAYFKRMTAINLMFGDADHHLRKVAKAGGLEQKIT